MFDLVTEVFKQMTSTVSLVKVWPTKTFKYNIIYLMMEIGWIFFISDTNYNIFHHNLTLLESKNKVLSII